MADARGRFGPKIGVILAVAFGGVVVAVGAVLVLGLFQNQLSPALFELALLAVTVTVLLAVSATLFRLLHGRRPQLPVGLREVRVRRRGVRRAAAIFLVLWLPIAILKLKFVAAFSLLLGAPLLMTFYFVAARTDRRATLVTVDPWVRWEYDPEEWRRVAELRQGTARRSLGKETPQLIAGPEGLLVGDRFLAWSEPGTRFVQSWREAEPPRVIFRFELVFKTSVRVEYVAPFPAGAERDWDVMQTKLARWQN